MDFLLSGQPPSPHTKPRMCMKPISTMLKIIMFTVISLTTLVLPAQAQNKITTITAKTLTIGMSGEQPPFNFVNTQETVIGYDVDIAYHLAEKMGLEVRIVLMPFAELIPALEKGKVDIVMSGLAVTEKRKKQVLFSVGYALGGKSILTTKANIRRIYESTGFNDESVKLVALKNSTSEELAKNRLAKAKLTPVKHYEDGLLAVLSGEADGMVADLTVCELAVFRDTTNKLTLLKRPIGTEKMAVALAKGNEALQKEINVHLTTFTEDGGTDALHNKWFVQGGWLDLVP